MKTNSDNLSFEENRVGESEEMIYQKEKEKNVLFWLILVNTFLSWMIFDDFLWMLSLSFEKVFL